eukprot:Opistho-1_new@52247
MGWRSSRDLLVDLLEVLPGRQRLAVEVGLLLGVVEHDRLEIAHLVAVEQRDILERLCHKRLVIFLGLLVGLPSQLNGLLELANAFVTLLGRLLREHALEPAEPARRRAALALAPRRLQRRRLRRQRICRALLVEAAEIVLVDQHLERIAKGNVVAQIVREVGLLILHLLLRGEGHRVHEVAGGLQRVPHLLLLLAPRAERLPQVAELLVVLEHVLRQALLHAHKAANVLLEVCSVVAHVDKPRVLVLERHARADALQLIVILVGHRHRRPRIVLEEGNEASVLAKHRVCGDASEERLKARAALLNKLGIKVVRAAPRDVLLLRRHGGDDDRRVARREVRAQGVEIIEAAPHVHLTGREASDRLECLSNNMVHHVSLADHPHVLCVDT